MIQIFWAGMDHSKWRSYRGGFNQDGIRRVRTWHVGPVEISYWHVARFGED